MKTPFPSRSFFFTFVIIMVVLAHQSTMSKNGFYNVLDHGIKSDGATLNTDAIASLIDVLHNQGGGTLYFPPGRYLTGSIHLKSHITLYLDAGAKLQFSQNFDDFLPMVKSRHGGTEYTNFSPPIYAYKAENIAIKGDGLIDGQGKVWWDFEDNLKKEIKENGKIARPSKWEKMIYELNKDLIDSFDEQTDITNRRGYTFFRPPMIQFLHCNNVLIENVSMKDPPFWTVNPVYCENVNITGITITNREDSPNTDGINPSSCRNVRISNCYLSTGDDCIAIKSGKNEDGRRVGRACENITITNCTMLKGHGGVVIGSEMSGDVRRVTISNCVFDGTNRGIRIKSTRGRGGIVEDIRVSNIVMKDIVREPFRLNMFYRPVPPEPVSERTPQFRNIHFSDITVIEANQAGSLLGLDEMYIKDVSFDNIKINAQKGFEVNNVQNIEFHNVMVNVEKGPAFLLEQVNSVELDGVSSKTSKPKVPVVDLINVQNVYAHSSFQMIETDLFMRISGDQSKGIVLENNNFSLVSRPYEWFDVSKAVITTDLNP